MEQVDPPKAHWDFRGQSKLAGWIEKGADFMRSVANRILNVKGGEMLRSFWHNSLALNWIWLRPPFSEYRQSCQRSFAVRGLRLGPYHNLVIHNDTTYARSSLVKLAPANFLEFAMSVSLSR